MTSSTVFQPGSPILSLLLATGQIVAPYWNKLTGRGKPEVQEVGNDEGPLTPAPATFAIWGPLYIGGLTYAGWAQGHKNDATLKKVGGLAGATFLLNILWSLNAQSYGLGWQSVGLISSAASTATLTAVRSTQQAQPWIAKPFAALAGWLTLATFANLETTTKQWASPLKPEQLAAAFYYW